MFSCFTDMRSQTHTNIHTSTHAHTRFFNFLLRNDTLMIKHVLNYANTQNKIIMSKAIRYLKSVFNYSINISETNFK